MKTIFILLLVSIFAFPKIYIVSQVASLPRIFIALLILTFFFFKKKTISISSSEKKIIFVWIIFVMYKFFIDFLQNDSIEGFNYFIINITYIGLFICIIKSPYLLKINYTKVLSFLFPIPILLGIIQLFNPFFRVRKIIPSNPYIFSSLGSSISGLDNTEVLRVTGPLDMATTYANMLGFIFIISFFLFFIKKKKIHAFVFSIVTVLMFYTQSRSFIYGVIPSIALALIIAKKWNKKTKAYSLVVFILLVFIFQMVLIPSVARSGSLEKTGKFLEVNTATKLISNIYGSMGVLNTSPLWGVPKKQNFEVILKGMEVLNIKILNRYAIQDTYHNQIISYFKFYGIIGLFLFLFLLFLLFKRMKMFNHFEMLIIVAYFIFILQFSMFHNYQLIIDYYFWITFGMFLLHYKMNKYATKKA